MRKDYLVMGTMAVILILIVSLTLVIGVKKMGEDNKKEKRKITESEEKQEVKSSLTRKEADLLLKMVDLYDDYFIRFDGHKAPFSMTNQEKIAFFFHLDEQYLASNGIDLNREVPLSSVSATLQKYFGKTISFFPESYLCPVDHLPLFVYDEEKKTYHLDTENHGHEGLEKSYITNDYLTGEKEKKGTFTTYKIKMKKVFSNPFTVGMPYMFYKTMTDALNRENVMFNLLEIYGEDDSITLDNKIKIQYEKEKGLYPVYTYTFRTESDINEAYLVNIKR